MTPMGLVVVGIGDCRVSAKSSDDLVTYALGSCIGVVIHDATAGVGGLLHLLLPHSSLNPSKAKANPFVFADSGIPILFRQAYALGARKERLVTQIIGGAQMHAGGDMWNIGKQNIAVALQILVRAGVHAGSDFVGGRKARTVRLDVMTGTVSVSEVRGNCMKALLAYIPGEMGE